MAALEWAQLWAQRVPRRPPGYISGTLFAVSLVLILAAVLLARLGFAAEDRERAAKRRKYGRINRTHARNPEYQENQERGA